MSPQQRADEFVAADRILVDRYERLTDDERTDLRVDVGFLPFPLTVATAGRMRLKEVVLHSWDVHVTFDEAAVLDPATVAVVLNGEPNLIGWLGKTDALDGRTLDLQAAVETTGAADLDLLRSFPGLLRQHRPPDM